MPEVVHQPGQGGQHLLGRNRIQRGRGLVEHEDARARGQHGADRHPLLLATGEVRSGRSRRSEQAEQVERLLDPAAHHVAVDAQRLHPVGQLLLDRVGDEGGDRVLADDADEVGEVAGAVGAGVPPVDEHRAATAAAAEVRDQPVDAAQQRRLAAAGRPDDEDQLSLVDR